MSKTVTSDAFGVDKVAFLLSGPEIEISPSFECEVQPAKWNAATGEAGREIDLWRSTSGNVVRGARAFLNTPDFNLDITPDRRDNRSVATLHFSGKAFREDNCLPLGQNELRETVQQVTGELLKRGLRADLERATLFRLDIAKQAHLDEPVSSYGPIFAAAGHRKRTSKVDYGGTGYLASNTRHELCCYDKGAEMHGNGVPVGDCPVNLLRAEHRLKRAPVIRERLGIVTSNVCEVLNVWENLEPEHESALLQSLFKLSAETVKRPVADLAGAAEETSGARYHWRAFLEHCGLALLVEKYGAQGAKNFTREHFDTKERHRREIEKAIDAVAFRLGLDGTTESGKPVRDLYSELEAKFLASYTRKALSGSQNGTK